MKRPLVLWILIFWLLFLALGGLYGGIAMLADPSGGLLQMAEVLPLLHVPDYILPALFLIVIMGLAPLFLIYGLLARPNWPWMQAVFFHQNYHWAWIGTLALGVVLAVWLVIEGILIGFKWPIQYVTAINEGFILLFTLLPPVRKFYLNQE